MFGEVIRHGNRQYRIESLVDDAAIEDFRAGIVIRGSVRTCLNPGAPAGREEWSDWESVDILAQVDAEAREIVFTYKDQLLARVPIDRFVPDMRGEAVPDIALAADDALLGADFHAELAENIISRMPPIDPLLGCLLRSAAGTLAGQVIRCWYAVDEAEDRIRQKLERTLGCLRENKWRMALRFLVRSGKCIVTAGAL